MKKKTLLNLLIIVGFGAVLLPASLSPNLFIFKKFGLPEITQLFTFLLLVSLFLERALEVFITTWRRPGEEEFSGKVRHCERRIAELKEQIRKRGNQVETVATKTTSEDALKSEKRTEFMQSPGDTSGLLVELDKEITQLSGFNQERGRFKSGTRKIALWSALFVGVLVSGAGVRGFETLVDLRALPDAPLLYTGQIFLFRSLDTLLTGGLIAGGSEGMHKLTQVFSAFLDETRNQIKRKPE